MKTTKVYKAPGYPTDPNKSFQRAMEEICSLLERRPAYPSRIMQDMLDMLELREIEITCKKRVAGYEMLLEKYPLTPESKAD